ncbi:hypothetical protein BpHYR1_048906 [Brachionus plicatilis]|uniref:Uncharacterized protein n=1 Tax=Brachionus plicatilis TaxID=10195 RepID=A0A3M7S1N9_BRAPC|nr:hypothetical protein BpHYR1_048906 [Brachionus plicatilis]
MSRRNSLTDPKKLVLSEPIFSNKTLIKIRQLNELAHRRPKFLPNIYAKAEQLNRRLSVFNPGQDSDFSSASSISYDNMNEKEREYFLKEYRHRKKSIIISRYLDDELKHRFEQLKYSSCPSRRASVFEAPSSTDLQDFEADGEMRKKSTDESTLSFHKNKSPRFGSTLSRDGQYAMMKSLEDTIINEIEAMYPECRGKISRTSTAQFRKSLCQSSSFLAPVSSKDIENRFTDSLYYSKSELFSETDSRETLPDIEMHKKMLVSQHIDNAMEILDKLRLNNKKSDKTSQPKKVNYLDKVLVTSTSKKNLAPIKNSASEFNFSNLDKSGSSVEPIVQFSQWKNKWTKELENY